MVIRHSYIYIILISFNVCSISTGQSDLELKLDSIIQDGIDSMAFPGAQLLVASTTQILLNKSYGHHTYDKIKEVDNHHLYDLASITKVSSGLPLLMQLYDRGLFNINAELKEYYQKFKNTNKANLKINEILSHQAGLEPYLVFWQNTLKENGKFKSRTFKSKPSKRFPIRIQDNLYLHRNYKKKMLKAIAQTPLADHTYKYSGLVFLLMPDIIEDIISADFESQLYQNIYMPLGIDRMLYNPASRFPIEEIVPTEVDTFFRNRLVHGKVHDEAAAMLNGVSCNAGLFANAESLAKLFQMYMNMGKHLGKRIISTETMELFTSYQFPENDNRRGLGFDKPLLEYEKELSYVAESASPESFGHSGFTGTFVWADPTHDILIVLLTNRVHPYRSQRNLYKMNIRPKLHQALYDHFASDSN